jgi:CHAT domain-containing protein
MLPTKRSSFKIARVLSIPLCVCMALVFIIFRVPEIPSLATETTSNSNGPIQIAPGSSIRRELDAGAKEVFAVAADQDKLLRFSIDKGDLVLSTALYGPTGIKLLEHVSHDFEVVELSFPTQLAGVYRIELQSHERAERRRPYELKLQPLSPVTTLNRTDSEARQAVARAERLRADSTENSFRQATEQYDKATLLWTSISDFASASHAALKSGDVYFLLSEYGESSKRYQNAEALAGKTGDWLAKARPLSQTGRLQSYLGKNNLAQKQLTQALYLFKQHEANRSVVATNAYGETLSNLAEVSYAKGDFVKSWQQLESALKVFQDHRKGEAKVHLFIAYIAGSMGDTEKAVAETSQAQGLYQTLNDKVGEALALTNLGLSHSRKGNDNRAIEIHLKAIEIFRSTGDRHSEAIALNALGQSHQNLGEHAIAINRYGNALRLFQEMGSVDGMSVATFQIATAYDASKNPDQALAYYERCLKLSRVAGKVRTEANALSEIAKLYVAQGLHKRAEEQYQKVLKFYEAIGDLRGQAIALNAYGDFFRHLKQTPGALDLYRRALPFSEEVGEQGILISTLYNLARANLALGSPEAALPFVQRSLKIIEDLRANVASPEFRVSYFSGVQKHYELCMQVLMELERTRPVQGFAVEAFLVSERGRARLLLDLVTESRANLRAGAANDLLERERKLRGLLRLQAQYRMDLSVNKRDTAEVAEVDNQMVQLRAEYQEVRAQLSKQQPRLFSLEHSAPLDLRRIQEELPDSETMLLEYALGENSSYLWVVTSNSFRAHELPAREIIEDAAREYYKLMTARQGTDGQVNEDYQASVEAADTLLAEKASKLSEMLLGPLAEQLGTRRLLVVPEGALQYIPFDALPAPVAKRGGPAGSPVQSATFLVETNEVVVLPSISTLIGIRGKLSDASSTSKLVAVIADPVFSGSDDRVQSETVSSGVALAAIDKNSGQTIPLSETLNADAGPARLTYASEEADAISAVAPWGTTLVAKGFEATRETAMSSDVSQYQIVHFATHGFLDNEHPELSGIVLTMMDRNGVKTNGLMPLHDIYSLDLSAELTVLSACQTALGKDIKGEGFVGLTHGFISAGSKSVVASLWKVDDRATAFLMGDFYESMLQKGMSPAAALRSAKLKMIREKRWSAPYYWAGFVLQGEYANRIDVDRHGWFRPVLVLLFLLILIAAALLVFQRRKRRFSPPPQSS